MKKIAANERVTMASDQLFVLALLLTLVLLINAAPSSSVSRSSTSRNTRSKDLEKLRPRHVTVQVINETSVRLQWHQPKTDVARCPVSRYTVRLKSDGSKKSRTWKVDGERQSVTLHDLEPSTSYYVRVLAVVCDGKGRPSPWVGVRTPRSVDVLVKSVSDLDRTTDETETTIPGKPTYVRTRTFSDSVIVSWLPPDDNIVVRGYMIGYGEGVPDVNWQYVDSTKNNVTIKNLKPTTQYIVSIRAFNNRGKGAVIYDLIYTREQPAGPAFASPIDLRTKVLSPSTLWLEWIDPTLGRVQQPTDTRYYNVHYRPLPPPTARSSESIDSSHSAAGRTLSVIVKELHVVFYDLQPGTRYEFKVRTVKDAVASAFSEPATNKTFETAPSSPPRNLMVMMTNASGTVHITWKPPRLPNGDITGYLVLYTHDPDLPTDRWRVRYVNGPEAETAVANLTLNTTYHFRIQARNSIGYSPLSSNSVFYTKMHYASVPAAETTLAASRPSSATETSTVMMTTTTADDVDFDEEVDATEEAETTLQENLHPTRTTPDDSPHAEKLVQSASDDVVKAKRDPRDRPSTADDAETMLAMAVTQIPFKVLVRHRVTAVISWPDFSDSCGGNGPDDSTLLPVVGYRLRYGESGAGELAALNLTMNAAVVDDLQPNSVYWYQMKRMYKDGTESAWTEQRILDTS